MCLLHASFAKARRSEPCEFLHLSSVIGTPDHSFVYIVHIYSRVLVDDHSALILDLWRLRGEDKRHKNTEPRKAAGKCSVWNDGGSISHHQWDRETSSWYNLTAPIHDFPVKPWYSKRIRWSFLLCGLAQSYK